jgi:hypothetical protein
MGLFMLEAFRGKSMKHTVRHTRKTAFWILTFSILLISADAQVNTAQQNRKPHVLASPFDPSFNSLPANFRGDYAVQVYRRLATLSQSLQKGEFETTEAYRRRVDTQPTPARLLAFVIDQEGGRPGGLSTPHYDADQQILHVRVELNGGTFGDDHDKNASRLLLLTDFITEHRFYKAGNALGARVIVEHYKHHIFEIEFKNHHDFPLARTFHDMSKDLAFVADIPMAPLAARRARKNMRMLIVCRAVPPYAVSSMGYIAPTIDEPTEESQRNYTITAALVEIWFFDAATGEVYAKQKAAKP